MSFFLWMSLSPLAEEEEEEEEAEQQVHSETAASVTPFPREKSKD